MASTSTIRTWWADYFKQGYTQRVTLLGRPDVKVHEFTLDAWRALEAALTANGYGKAQIVSTYYPRYIAGTTKWSLHSYSGVALDIDPALNPYKKGVTFNWSHTKFTEQQVNAVKAIRTNSGARPWRWGGDSFGTLSHDYMHWQIDCRPEDIASGINWGTVPASGPVAPSSEEGDMILLGDDSEAVKLIQQGILGWDPNALPEWGADADFGSETAEWAVKFQTAHGLVPTRGQIGGVTASLALSYLPKATVAVGGVDELEDRIRAAEARIVSVDSKAATASAKADAVDGKVEAVKRTLRSV